MKSSPKAQQESPSGTSILTLILTVIAAISLGLGIWMYVTTRQQSEQIASLQADSAQLREHANATLYVMEPADIAPSGIRGEVYLTISRSGVVALSGLPAPGSNEAYSLWLINESEGTTTLAGTIFTNNAGQGFALLPADSPPYNQIAISLETVGTSAPEGGFLLRAEVLPGKG